MKITSFPPWADPALTVATPPRGGIRSLPWRLSRRCTGPTCTGRRSTWRPLCTVGLTPECWILLPGSWMVRTPPTLSTWTSAWTWPRSFFSPIKRWGWRALRCLKVPTNPEDQEERPHHQPAPPIPGMKCNSRYSPRFDCDFIFLKVQDWDLPELQGEGELPVRRAVSVCPREARAQSKSSILVPLIKLTAGWFAEGRDQAQQVQDQAVSEVLDQWILCLWTPVSYWLRSRHFLYFDC